MCVRRNLTAVLVHLGLAASTVSVRGKPFAPIVFCITLDTLSNPFLKYCVVSYPRTRTYNSYAPFLQYIPDTASVSSEDEVCFCLPVRTMK